MPNEMAQMAGTKMLELAPISTCAIMTGQSVGKTASIRAAAASAAARMIGLYVLHSSNYLDTRAAGSYNRRPLSPGTSARH